ncbi:Gfo/Idh/MocA family protein [Celerinatantimonas sp. YJH-8]|uniref:Gfo/Idh/MocA family protein n=1 Tax=Celerinatantimonas sp. YJH-8 TaxID=3228714 RepID=UPI0038CA92BF
MSHQKVRWGIAGLGGIAHRFAADLTQQAENAELYAVAASQLPRAEQFAGAWLCPVSYGSYLELAQDPLVEAVYVAGINPLHRSMVELFLSHGKHVLVEKPAFTNLKDWDEMQALAQSKQVVLCEAMKSVVFPAYQHLRRFIWENHLQIDSVAAAFGFSNPFDVSNRLFNSDLCGGATLDVGVYALWLYADLCHLTQTPIMKPSLQLIQDNPESKVDETVTFLFDAPIQGAMGASITRDLSKEAVILGPDLKIVIHEKWWNPKTIDICYQGHEQQLTTPERGGGFEYEIEHVSELILTNKLQSDILRSETSRAVISIMENSLIEMGFKHLLYAQ